MENTMPVDLHHNRRVADRPTAECNRCDRQPRRLGAGFVVATRSAMLTERAKANLLDKAYDVFEFAAVNIIVAIAVIAWKINPHLDEE
jgi:hypothetical protein